MARTFIGQLVLRLQTQGLTEAKKVEGAMRSIEGAAKRLSLAPWGAGFQRQLDKLGLNARELNDVRRSWANLERDLVSRNLGAALKKSEIGAWRTATVGHFAAVRSSMRETERTANRIGQSIRTALHPAYVMLGGYTGVYIAGRLGREGIAASAERQREYFRQRMGDIPEAEREAIFARSERLSLRYPSVNITDVMEMARTARNTMGTTERGLAILEEMTRGLVALQTAKGIDAAPGEMSRLLRGIDNLGQNANGETGIQAVKDIINGLVKAAQIEGVELDSGELFDVARRSKIAGPSLSTEFIMTTAPAFMQDMTSHGFGTALSSAYKAFVVGAKDVAGKVYIAEQKRIGIRAGEGQGQLVDGDLFGTNPYAWVKKYLIPALQKDGVDIANDTAVAKAVSGLSGNTNATGLLTRMITQQDQVDRLVSLYNRAMGTSAADEAKDNDPFVAWKGFTQSLENLSASLGEHVMPVIVPSLNRLSGSVSSFAQLVQQADPRVMSGAAAVGGAAAIYGTWKVSTAIWGLATAGTNLNAAAASLEAAALSLRGGGATPGSGTASGTGTGFVAGALAWLRGLAVAGAPGFVSTTLSDTPGNTFEEQVANQRKARAALQRGLGIGDKPAFSWSRLLFGDAADPDFNLRDHMRINKGGGALDTSAIKAQAEQAGTEIKDALSVTATPKVDPSSIDSAIEKAQRLLSVLREAGSAAASANSGVDAQLRRGFADYGVAP
ncbi:hypothetical protein C7441_11464 [Pseudaminobacter salicylatoxidans]|uniref:Uncharacterized protein n=1 Tax=Pseudaminobacter salicylatoxidans TaxID=93369 RepID=A0A316BYP8_PSESE|nr:hypothetical protein [Pseudaminobacter salicylatoxidans]PWJ79787.1 hypothetical protein C7441_11464 [Pseudaminobacter salicylatoxidans]